MKPLDGESLSYLDYVKAAFHLKVPVSGLGHLPLNKLVLAGFAILGLGNPAFWLLGLAGEIAYLTFLPGSLRFQKLVHGSRLLGRQQQSVQRQAERLARLDPQAQQRFADLVGHCQSILSRVEESPTPVGREELSAGGLSQLQSIFFRLLNSQQAIGSILAKTDRREIATEIDSIQRRLTAEGENSAVARSVKGTLEIQQRRLENLDRAGENLKVIEAELERIEKQVRLIAEETTFSGDTDLLSQRLDGITQSLQGTTRWMSEHGEFFGQLEDDPAPVPSPPLRQKE